MCRSTAPIDEPRLAAGDEWIKTFNVNKFGEEIRALGERLEKEQGEEDVHHFKKMVLWCNMCGFVGLITMGFCVNPISIFLLSTFTFTRFAMVAHHTCHGSMDKIHPNKKRWNRFKFAVGSFWRRFCDWLDWILPEAWNVEHNTRHHYNLSETEDPDLVEENLSVLRDMKAPLLVKYANVAFFMLTWKWFYYAPNTYKELKLAKLKREGKKPPQGVNPAWAVTWKDLLSGGTPFYSLWEFVTVVAGPYLLFRFILTPLPLIFIGEYLNMPDMYSNGVKSLILSEMLSNAHAFLCIVTNHAGSDMYRFRFGCRPFSGSFFMRQVTASANYNYGSDLLDFMQGYLNYQVEHHLWPSLTMKSYQKAAPIVREICDRHGIPYVKESVFIRLKKTVDIAVGTSSMKWFPESYEKKYLEMDAIMEQKKLMKKST